MAVLFKNKKYNVIFLKTQRIWGCYKAVELDPSEKCFDWIYIDPVEKYTSNSLQCISSEEFKWGNSDSNTV